MKEPAKAGFDICFTKTQVYGIVNSIFNHETKVQG